MLIGADLTDFLGVYVPTWTGRRSIAGKRLDLARKKRAREVVVEECNGIIYHPLLEPRVAKLFFFVQ